MGILSWLFGTKSAATSAAARLPGPGEYQFGIVGKSHYQDALSQICGGKTFDGHALLVEAVLLHENDNPYDNQAVGVVIRSKKVGYLSRDNTREFRRQMKAAVLRTSLQSVPPRLSVVGTEGLAMKENFGVKLDLPIK